MKFEEQEKSYKPQLRTKLYLLKQVLENKSTVFIENSYYCVRLNGIFMWQMQPLKKLHEIQHLNRLKNLLILNF